MRNLQAIVGAEGRRLRRRPCTRGTAAQRQSTKDSPKKYSSTITDNALVYNGKGYPEGHASADSYLSSWQARKINYRSERAQDRRIPEEKVVNPLPEASKRKHRLTKGSAAPLAKNVAFAVWWHVHQHKTAEAVGGYKRIGTLAGRYMKEHTQIEVHDYAEPSER